MDIAEEIGFIGRAREATQVLGAIERGQRVLVSGRAGVGKSAFLRYVHDAMAQKENTLTGWVPAGNTKEVLLSLARQCHETFGLHIPEDAIPKQNLARAKRLGFLPWADLERSLRRITVAKLGEIVLNTIEDGHREMAVDGRRCIVFLESLEISPGQAEFFARLTQTAQVVAAIDSKNKRRGIKKLLWSFQTKIDLRPLSLGESEEVTARWLDKNPLRFSNQDTQRRFVRHVAQDSGGVPEAIAGMLAHAATEDEITPAKAREFTHEASEAYFDMTPLVLLGVAGFTALRYISRGISETELMVLSGVGSAVFMALMLMLRGMRERGR